MLRPFHDFARDPVLRRPGVVVQPGDLIVADEIGVTVVPRANA